METARMVEMLVDLNADAVDRSAASDTDAAGDTASTGDTDAAAAAVDPAVLAFYRFIDARRRYNRLPATARIDAAGGVEAA